MTAVTDISEYTPIAEAPRMVSGQRWLTRSGQKIAGTALMLAAAGMWVLPGASWDADVALIKLGLTVGVGLAGLTAWMAGRSVPLVEIEIDTVRREVRLVRGKAKSRTLVSRTRIGDLGQAEVCGTMVRLWDGNGSLLAEVAMSDPAVRRSLTTVLRDEGKL